MAHYLIRYNGKTYANRELVKDALRIGDAGITRVVAAGELSVEMLLGNPVYAVLSPGIERTLTARFAYNQLLDDGLDKIRERIVELPMNEPSPLECGELGGVLFVRLQDITDPNKYRWVQGQPTLRVCGTIYVAWRLCQYDACVTGGRS